MFAARRPAASAYRSLDVETLVHDADPHKLVEMLYDGAIVQVGKARHALNRGDTTAKGEATSRAIRIVDEGLKAALDASAGTVAHNLDALYDYATRVLVQANLRNNDSQYAEVERLLGELRSAWREIGPAVRNGVPA
ncbi:MAG: flagellar export chaperone FliS [Lautropia sp.]